jgi:hypothetical protein
MFSSQFDDHDRVALVEIESRIVVVPDADTTCLSFSGRILIEKKSILADIIFSGSLLGQTYVLELTSLDRNAAYFPFSFSVFGAARTSLFNRSSYPAALRFTRLAIPLVLTMRCQIDA